MTKGYNYLNRIGDALLECNLLKRKYVMLEADDVTKLIHQHEINTRTLNKIKCNNFYTRLTVSSPELDSGKELYNTILSHLALEYKIIPLSGNDSNYLFLDVLVPPRDKKVD